MHQRPRDRPIEDSSSGARSGEYTGSDPSTLAGHGCSRLVLGVCQGQPYHRCSSPRQARQRARCFPQVHLGHRLEVCRRAEVGAPLGSDRRVLLTHHYRRASAHARVHHTSREGARQSGIGCVVVWSCAITGKAYTRQAPGSGCLLHWRETS
jgi:hypothetical protein